MRRIIQICASKGLLVALCDDHSLWAYLMNSDNREWTKIDDIPQDKPRENKVTFEKINPERS